MSKTTDPDRAKSPKSKSPTAVFVGMALDMTWRLAVVVLLPIIGGYQLDQHFGTEPWLTITGFVLAGVGGVLVMRQTLQVVDEAEAQAENKEKEE